MIAMTILATAQDAGLYRFAVRALGVCLLVGLIACVLAFCVLWRSRKIGEMSRRLARQYSHLNDMELAKLISEHATSAGAEIMAALAVAEGRVAASSELENTIRRLERSGVALVRLRVRDILAKIAEGVIAADTGSSRGL